MWWDSPTRYLDWLPRMWEDIAEIRALGEAVGPEIDSIKSKLKQVIHNKYPQTADLDGVRHWEALLGIAPERVDLQYRRDDIVTRLKTRLPINLRMAQKVAEGYLGVPVKLEIRRYHLWINYRGNIRLPDTAPLEQRLREIIPANMGNSTAYDDVKWGELKPYRWGALQASNWGDVRKGVPYGEEAPWQNRQITSG